MAWTTTPYCTLADVKLALDPNLSGVDDTFLNSLIQQAQTYLDREIGYAFQQDGTATSPASRLYSGDGGEVLEIDGLVSLYTGAGSSCSPQPCGGVIETYTVTYLQGGVNWVLGSTTTRDITADIKLRPSNYTALGVPARKMARNSGWHFADGIENYQVFGIFGVPILAGQIYPGVPNDIMRATTRLAVHYYKMRDTNYADMIQEQGGIRERYIKNVPIDVVEVIENYVHRRYLTR